jgi:hypothetical protein
MQRIKSLKSKQKLENSTVYTYIVADEVGHKQEITDLNVYEIGDRVEVWFKDKYNKPGMRLYQATRAKKCSKCKKEYLPEDDVYHEFCNISHAGTDI